VADDDQPHARENTTLVAIVPAMRSPAGRVAIVVGAAVVLVVLFVVLRGRDDDEPDAQGTTSRTFTIQTTTSPTTATTRTTTVPATTAPAGPRRIDVTVAGGSVAGGVKTVRVAQGESVVLVVRADVSDHVHLHGYDRMADVAPGAPAQLRFRATIAGRFEVELEDRKLRILEVEVRP
jgi:hypothetical protein